MIKASAARITGRSHVASAAKCQDAVAVLSGRGAACIAVADGAGSKKRSDIGAIIASEIVAAVVLKKFDRLLRLGSTDESVARKTVLFPVLQAFRRKNKRRKEPIDAMACTLLFAAYKNGRFIAGHIGDGVIAITNGAEPVLLSSPENGEFLNTTVFVTDKDALQHLRLYTGNADAGFGAMLMSDGTAESLYDRSQQKLAPAVKTLFEWSQRLPDRMMESVLLSNLQEVFSKKSTDDCSMAVMSVS